MLLSVPFYGDIYHFVLFLLSKRQGLFDDRY